MAFVELNIDPKFHRHIVGRSGANSQSRLLLIYCTGWISCTMLVSSLFFSYMTYKP